MRKKVLALVLALVMVIAMLPTVAFAADFADTKGHWAETQIDRWSDFGVVGGDGTGFNPNGSMTRAQAAQVFVNLLKLTKAGDITAYTDVPATAWYADAISKVAAKGIMNGMSATTMAPDGTLTREQMFVMIGRALGVEPVETATKTFVDGKETSDWATGYINALADMGVINGTGNNELNPTDVINRASVMTVLDNLIGGYANEEGQTVEIVEGKITLIVADDVKVTGTADPDMPIVVAGAAKTVDLEGVTVTGDAAPVVQVQVSDVKVENAPVGAEIKADEGTTGVTANGIDVSADADKDVVIPESTPTTPSTPAIVPPVVDPTPSSTNEADTAVTNAWTALKSALETAKLSDLIIADVNEDGTYTLTLDADKISASSAAIEGAAFDTLMSAIKNAISTNFVTSTLEINGQVVYANGAFNNTNLKAALVDVASGFFVKLSTMTDKGDNVYEYKTITGTVKTPDSVVASHTDEKTVTLAIQLKGADVEKIQKLATKFAEYLSMDQMTLQEITTAYGTGNILSNIPTETQYIVVGVELPPSVKAVTSNISPDNFNSKKVSEAFDALKIVNVPQILGPDDQSNVESALKTINSNAALINKVLGKMTSIKVGGIELTSKEFTPEDTGETTWAKFVGGVAALFGTESGSVGAAEISTYALTGASDGGNYYAVPVTVTFTDVVGVSATETIIVILDIPLNTATD